MKTQYRHFYSMGTRLDAVFIDIEEKHADKLGSIIKTRLVDIENILSIYRQDSELSMLNRSAYKREVVVSQNLLNALLICKKYYKITGGVFDAGMISPSSSSTDLRDNTKVHFELLRERSGMKNVELDEEKKSVRYLTRNVYIDPGGFGKGMAIKEVKDILLAEGVQNALISFGESSVLALGSHPQGDYWPVAVTDIFDNQSVARLAKIRDTSISTSGTGFVDNRGLFKPAGNIFDPRTGEIIKDPRTVSFISADPVEAEILSTSLLIDTDCITEGYELSGKEAFAVDYDSNRKFVVNEIL